MQSHLRLTLGNHLLLSLAAAAAFSSRLAAASISSCLFAMTSAMVRPLRLLHLLLRLRRLLRLTLCNHLLLSLCRLRLLFLVLRLKMIVLFNASL